MFTVSQVGILLADAFGAPILRHQDRTRLVRTWSVWQQGPMVLDGHGRSQGTKNPQVVPP